MTPRERHRCRARAPLLALVAVLAVALAARAYEASPGVAVAGVAFAFPDYMAGPDGDDGATRPPAPGAMSGVERALLDETNRDRAATGLGALAPDPELLPVARARARAQVPLPTLSHLDPGGALAFLSLIQRAGVRHQVAGENLVRLPGPTSTAPGRAEVALMASPTHRANILDARYGRLAVGLAIDGTGRVIFAQLFRDAS